MRAVLVFLSVLLLAIKCSAHDEGKLFCFSKSHNNSKEFEYQLENGEKHRGTTTFLFEQLEVPLKTRLFFNLLLDDFGQIYWVPFTKDEIDSSDPLPKFALTVNKTENGIEFQDDHLKYSLDVGDEHLGVYPYITEWDFKNICFKRTDGNEHLFQYEIKSLNNGRKYTGTTYVEKEDKERSQRIRVADQGEYIIRIDFKEDEFDSNEPFCRDISEIISQYLVLGAGSVSGIDPNALKSLVG